MFGGRRVQSRDVRARFQRLKPRPLARFEPDLLAQPVGNNKDIGKENCAIESEAPDRLKRYFRCRFRRIAKIQEG